MNFDIIDNSNKDAQTQKYSKNARGNKAIKHKRLNDLEKETLGLEVDILLDENINF